MGDKPVMHPKHTRKLSRLSTNRETLRTLGAGALTLVAGGEPPPGPVGPAKPTWNEQMTCHFMTERPSFCVCYPQ